MAWFREIEGLILFWVVEGHELVKSYLRISS